MIGPGQPTTAGQVRRALSAIVGIDDQIVADSARFGRAIADALPDDERSCNLLTLSAQLGVPVLVQGRYGADAVVRLTEDGGIDRRAALAVVQWWAETLLPETGTLDFLPQGDPHDAVESNDSRGDLTADDLNEHPIGVYQVRIACLSEQELLVAISTSDGFFSTLVRPFREEAPRWRRIASPDSPLSRDLFVHQASRGRVLALWSNKRGIEGRPVWRTGDQPDSDFPQLSYGQTSTLVPTESSNQIRYPIAALSTAPGLIDIFWTSDRQKLCRSSLREGVATATPQTVPDACYGAERLSILDALQLNDHHCSLAALTDRSRILVADWDLDIDLHGSWRSVAVPMDDMMAISMVRVDERALLFASTKQGRVFAVDLGETVGESWPWWQVNLPDSLSGPETRSISVASHGEYVAIATSGKAGLSVGFAKLHGRRLEVQDVEWILR
jgi:hypothetical protein